MVKKRRSHKKGRKIKYSKCLRIPKTAQEEYLRAKGFEKIAGLDEVGRGAWAGPLVAAAVILPQSEIKNPTPLTGSKNAKIKKIYRLRDSKLLTSKERQKLAGKIKKTCQFGIGEVSAKEIDRLKLTKATELAFLRSIENLKVKPDFVLIDGFRFKLTILCQAIKKGDMVCSSIAAASIIAKDHRDKIMRNLDQKIGGYYFAKHKGYGTKLHQQRLKKLGPTPFHRKSFLPIQKLTRNKN